MRRVAIVAVTVAGLALLGTGARGLAALDGRLADGAERPATKEVEIRQGLRGGDDCPWRERPEDRRPPLPDERRL